MVQPDSVMVQTRITIVMVILYIVGVLGFLAGWQSDNRLVNDLALVSILIGWVLARWLGERDNPLYIGKKPVLIIMVLSVPALAGLLIGVVLLRPFPEHLRIVAGLSGVIGWVVLSSFFALQNRTRFRK